MENGFEDRPIYTRDMPDYWAERGDHKVPAHLVELYDQGRLGADELDAIADIVDSVEEYEVIKASVKNGTAGVDERYFEIAGRLVALRYDQR